MTDSSEQNRYLYAFVDLDRADPDAFEAEGIDGTAARIVRADGIGAVVHDCDGLYDSDDPVEVRSWLLAHQRVIDAATELFGTPLPVRFDTIIQGGDDAVREWVEPVAEEITAHLERFRGRREYRIRTTWDADAFEAEMRDTDEELAALKTDIERESDGTAFLKEKQYDQRLGQLRREHSRRLRQALIDLIEPTVEELTEQESAGTSPLAADEAEQSGTDIGTVVVLAETAAETELGDRLDEYVDQYDVEVRFTGPWPPYSFTPTFTE